MLQFEIEELHLLLKSYPAFIAHCASTPGMVGVRQEKYMSPYDCIEGAKDQNGLSCSIIKPMDGRDNDRANYTGDLGVILRCRSKNSILRLDKQDAGDANAEMQVELADAVKSIIHRHPCEYNEWVLKDYEIIGAFANKGGINFYDAQGTLQFYSYKDVRNSLPACYPLYALDNGLLWNTDSNGTPLKLADYHHLYPNN